MNLFFKLKEEVHGFLIKVEENSLIDTLGPIGDGVFDSKDYKNIAIIGGGIGIFPLYELAKQTFKKANINTYLGFRNKEFIVLEDEFKKVSKNLLITTDDGTYGMSGYAINYLEKDLENKKIDAIFACRTFGDA